MEGFLYSEIHHIFHVNIPAVGMILIRRKYYPTLSQYYVAAQFSEVTSWKIKNALNFLLNIETQTENVLIIETLSYCK